MRTYGRTTDEYGNKTWVQVETDANGFNDLVYLTTLCQVLKLNINESPFYANYGIAAYQSVTTQVFPDYYAMQTQTNFAPYFASLLIQRIPTTFPPVYNVKTVCHSGAILTTQVAT